MGDLISYDIGEASSNPLENLTLEFYKPEAFEMVLASDISSESKARLISDISRFNIMYMISSAGSGHIGSSFSTIDILTWLMLNVRDKINSDIVFSSKGHDIPAFYALYTGLGVLPFDDIHKFRKYNGLPGHPDSRINGFPANTGSLGMGVSKAKGFIKAHDLNGNHISRHFVILGDGELQEGQNWEALNNVDYMGFDRLYIIVDNNKVQSDKLVKKTSDLGDLEAKFKSFGCNVVSINGHSFSEIKRVFTHKHNAKVNVIISDTIKGKGVSFMEHDKLLVGNQQFYEFHSGAPKPSDYKNAIVELKNRIGSNGSILQLNKNIDYTQKKIIQKKDSIKNASLIKEYSKVLVAEAKRSNKLIVYDADLILDNGLIEFSEVYPDQFIECGIAEQDMVSQAGASSLEGFIPVVHSFASFLTARAAEQIYNNACQGSKVIYVGTLAGLLPGGPGSSHQSVRDIGMMKGLGLNILEPSCPSQLASIMDFCVRSETSSYLRLTSLPVQNHDLDLPSIGRGNVIMHDQTADTTVICIGAIMLEIAQAGLKVLDSRAKAKKFNLIETPWISEFDEIWYKEQLKGQSKIIIMENHLMNGGIFESINQKISGLYNAKVESFSVKRMPLASGENDKVLEHHGLTVDQLLSLIQ